MSDCPPFRARVSSKKTFRTKDVDYTLLLATDRLDLPAEIIALLFTRRWQIELFFRWFKCVLGCNHLVALSQNGLTIQVYPRMIPIADTLYDHYLQDLGERK